MSRDRRDAERAARRARRLAERAEERALRKERQAEQAAERAGKLAEKASHRSSRANSRNQDLDRSIEDLVDEVTEKAEAWIDELIDKSRDDDRDVRKAESQAKRAQREAEKARASADHAERAAEEMSSSVDDEFENYESSPGKSRRTGRRRYGHGRSGSSWARARRRRTAHLYRDRERKKILGVCAGIADYFGRPAWEIRVYAVLGMFFIPQIVFPAYFITYFFMEDKPYYRRVTDRFDDEMDTFDEARDHVRDDVDIRAKSKRKERADMAGRKPRGAQSEDKMSNVQAMKTAKDKFSDIEQRLRRMESHVTSSQFELQRELKKISGED